MALNGVLSEISIVAIVAITALVAFVAMRSPGVVELAMKVGSWLQLKIRRKEKKDDEE